MQSGDLTAGSHTAATGAALRNGAIYTVAIENLVDLAGNPASPVTSANVTFDTQAVSITAVSPLYRSIIANAVVGYTLSENAQSGTVQFLRTGGAVDPGSPHSVTLAAGDLTAGAHSVAAAVSLVDEAFYTVTLRFQDLAGNPATSLSNALVFYASFYGLGPAGNVDNADGLNIVNNADLQKLQNVMGSRPGDAMWNPLCDLNRDNVVDGKDLMILKNNYGQALP
jgi:hypothetical protein